MANIVELREKDSAELEEMIENGREELFNLRFQHAALRVTDTTRIRTVRRQIAQVTAVLHNRQLAIGAAKAQGDIAAALSGRDYEASSRYIYEDAAYQVEFSAEDNTIATALVDLNKKQPKGRRARAAAGQPQLVVSHEVK